MPKFVDCWGGPVTREILAEEREFLRETLAHHLRSNFYPPLPSEFVDVAIQALARAEASDWHSEVTWPDVEIWPSESRQDDHGKHPHDGVHRRRSVEVDGLDRRRVPEGLTGSSVA